MPSVDLFLGPLIQCAEAATLGMPFEVWKTRMGRFRQEGTLEAFANIYKQGGVKAFWAGTGPKMFESGSKGMILMYAKEGINDNLRRAGVGPTLAGVLAGAGGGIAQVSVMGPCTYLVTGAVNNPGVPLTRRIAETYARGGLKAFYPGGTAIAFRQATNWASRQGFTEFIRHRMKVALHGDQNARLTKAQEVGAGVIGGTMACWNHPFEVARIEAQTLGNMGKPVGGMVTVMRDIARVDGVGGLFRGIVPRVGLGIWQTLFMVTGAKLIKDELQKREWIAVPEVQVASPHEPKIDPKQKKDR
uniref:Mitochondrial carrier family n=1 Tax=Micromonas pusilla TaxID=38833 RepID=A0A7S0NII4_MICPS|mmetsp:Transcript_13195/g.55772  ORF Transcript_13195/g.55772 Transcript_13195/m.55772 type:complete len:302 (+) Transcript_13195:153-1058(+)